MNETWGMLKIQRFLPKWHNTLELFILFLFILIICLAYLPGIKLFFRNDEWNMMGFLNARLNWNDCIVNVFKILLYDNSPNARHLTPVTFGLIMGKYLFLGNTFSLHFAFSLLFHLFNIILVYLVGLCISTNRSASVMGAVLFGSAAIIADTVLWSGQISFIIITTTTLISIYFHPVLSNSSRGNLTAFVFYITIAISPLIHELGFITILLAITLFICHGQFKRYSLAMLTLLLIMPLIARIIIMGGGVGIFYTHWIYLISNVFIGEGKLLYGLFGAVFHTQIADTLYILWPNVNNLFTHVAILLMLIGIPCLWLFIKHPLAAPTLKRTCIVMLIISSVPFVMYSLAFDLSNPNLDLPFQMPRYFYFPAVLMAIPLAQGLMFVRRNLMMGLVLGIFLVGVGIFNINQQIASLRPHTDRMRTAVAVYKSTGKLPSRGPVPADLILPYRLDWSFNENNVIAYLELGRKCVWGRFHDIK